MKQSELKKLIKIEDRINEIAVENGLKFCEIQFDIVPEQKMFEIMAYGMPGQISNWKFGRDFERVRTIYEKRGAGLPYEVVVNTNPARAYLMKDNTFGLNALIIAHVVAHVAFYTMNKYFSKVDNNLSSRLSAASKRFENYERRYGIDSVEKTVDAGHAIMFHSNPFLSEETEEEKLERVFSKMKKQIHEKEETEWDDFFEKKDLLADVEREKFNHQLYMKLKNKTPIEPVEDLLRYIIDNSRGLVSWQKDILEIIRALGQYYWPNIQTKYLNEGFATFWHEKILRQLFNEGLLSHNDHAECNYSNSLVKAKNPFSMNPYLIGSEIWKDIVNRWDKGQHGRYWEELPYEERMNYDDKSMKGMEKMFEVLRTHTDWIFMNSFLTADLVKNLELYVYMVRKDYFFERAVITDKMPEETRKIIINSFAHSHIPKISVYDGNHVDQGFLALRHEHVGVDLDKEYANKTLEHIAYLWNNKVILDTKKGKENFTYVSEKPINILKKS